ncbi:MAG: 4-hydroxy-tetrahydrodipicolinate reductase [Bacteroidota bacterium]|uniref:4-hydroxy-tetrahydrodipicolinate reductase n=1 Tax=Parabacteroides sp. FAFU027 TaxID=2922715 RepID=UPI001FB032B2|nr:4-hydroxy-tetrahydrodipicolinate reductase [Parabacteroides sp. FAFU027]MDP4268772.1 4-hydroxy-tetrahydrodipicolinate reductase [Bacteroidota bacterium]
MKIALIGYGKMGHEIEQIAISRGHEIVSIIDVNNPDDFTSEAFQSAEVAIEFTAPSVALENYRKCFAVNMPVVAGTTGWLDNMPEIKEACDNNGKTFFYASNYSLGVNIFFALNKHLAKIMNNFPDYDVKMTEIHHIHKLDAPSGTAITLAEGVLENIDRKTKWALKDGSNSANELAIEALREGEVPGYHSIIYESVVDTITITHDAKSRKGFALGAVVAAEFTAGKKGFLTMEDMLKF